MKKVLVSVVDDDQFFRESMCRLMRSLGYTADFFSSAGEFLASPRLAETACLIADIQMPAMTGLELYRRLIDTGQAIPTILVTAFPNDVDRARALKMMGSYVTCASRWMMSISRNAFATLSDPRARLKRIRDLSFGARQGELKYGAARLVRRRPQLAAVSMDDGPAYR